MNRSLDKTQDMTASEDFSKKQAEYLCQMKNIFGEKQ